MKNTQEDYPISKAELLQTVELQLLSVTDKNFESWKKQSHLFLDENVVWRFQGWISNADIPSLVKHPMLLHKYHHLTKLFVKGAHEKVLHNGVKEEDSKGTPTVHHSHHPYPLSE